MNDPDPETKITDLVEQIKNGGDAGIVTEEAKKLSWKERKRLYKDAVSGIDNEIVVLEALLPKLPNSTDDYNQVLAQIKSLTEARQVLTKNHTEIGKAKWSFAGAAVTTGLVLTFEFFKGPIIGSGKSLIHKMK